MCVRAFVLACLVCAACARRLQRHQAQSRSSEERHDPLKATSHQNFSNVQSLAEVDHSEILSEQLDSMSTLQMLKDDILKFLQQEPHWHIFSENFQLIDQAGAVLLGLEPYKLLLDLLRSMHGNIAMKDVQVWFTEKHWISTYWQHGKFQGDFHEPSDSFIVADWRVHLGGEGSSLHFWHKGEHDNPVVIEAETVFHFNNENKVDYMWIKKCFANGQPLLVWPEVDLFNTVDMNLPLIGEWLQAIKDQTTGEVELATLDHGYLATADVGALLDTLKADVSQIFNKEPHWSIFAEDFAIIDRAVSGAALLGSEAKELLQLLRRLHEKFAVDDVQVQFIELNWIHSAWRNGRLRGEFQEPLQPLIAARWQVQLGSKGSMLNFRHNDDDPFVLEAEMVLHLNGESRIESVQIDELSVNGFELLSWPDVDLLDTPAVNLERTVEWVQDVKEEIEEEEAKEELEEEEEYSGELLTLDQLQELLGELNPEELPADEESIYELLKGLESGELPIDEETISELLRDLQSGQLFAGDADDAPIEEVL